MIVGNLIVTQDNKLAVLGAGLWEAQQLPSRAQNEHHHASNERKFAGNDVETKPATSSLSPPWRQPLCRYASFYTLSLLSPWYIGPMR